MYGIGYALSFRCLIAGLKKVNFFGGLIYG